MGEDIRADKQAIRIELRERRRRLSAEERALQSLKFGGQIAAFLESRKITGDAVVGVYYALPEELDPAPAAALLYSMGATVCYPATFGCGDIDFYPLSAGELDAKPRFLTEANRFITRDEMRGFEAVDPTELDLIVVPGVGFDKKRNRMGYGAGCYDHFLTQVREDCLLIGACFDNQLVEELPVEPTDRAMDVIITPSVAF